MKKNAAKINPPKVAESRPNLDPVAGAPGAHPVGVGSGAIGGAVAGAVAGGLAGKGAAEAINPTAEHAFWRGEFAKRPPFTQDAPYEEYAPAYQFGWESCSTYAIKGKTFHDFESELQREWDGHRGPSQLSWEDAHGAVRDAWHRAEKLMSRP